MPIVGPGTEYRVALNGNRLVNGALRILGSIDPEGEEPSASETSGGLEALNYLLDSWNAEEFNVPAMTTLTFSLVSGTQTYRIGPGETWDSFRPRQLTQGQCMVKLGNVEYPLKVYTRDEWAAIRLKALSTAIPYGVFYDNDQPATLSFYPIPGADSFVLYEPKLLAQITNKEEVFYLPPAYAEALKWGLAFRLWAEYPNKDIYQHVSEMAASTKAAAKRPNTTADALRSELALLNLPDGWIDSGAFQRGF
jgi:hypothetical protein